MKKFMRWAFEAGSSSRQNGWPATVVGSMDIASTAEDRRGIRPVARAEAAAIWTTALTRTMVTGSVGIGAPGAAAVERDDLLGHPRCLRRQFRCS